MPKKIDEDQNRFRKIVRGKIKHELRKYVSKGEMIARKGEKTVKIPMPQIQIPKFSYGKNQKGGVGQGDGEPGDPTDGKPQDGAGEAGDASAEHELEVEITIEELAKIMGEELELPRIKPKGKTKLITEKTKYTGLRKVGPESLKVFKRTYKEALKRMLISGEYNFDDPIVVPVNEDRRYRSWQTKLAPESNAVIIYIMDVSGSMGEEQKELVRIEAFWIDTWIRSQYKNLESVYIIHDADAREVDEHTFYHVKEAGGTKISTAYQLADTIIKKRYNPNEFNIYVFHFSDGDNWGLDDSSKCVNILTNEIFPAVNLFGYGQVKSAYGSGKFKGELDEAFPDEEVLVTSDIQNKDEIWDSIKKFLSTGK